MEVEMQGVAETIHSSCCAAEDVEVPADAGGGLKVEDQKVATSNDLAAIMAKHCTDL